MTLALLSLTGPSPQSGPLPRVTDVDDDGGFRLQRLPGRPGIDGRAWIKADDRFARPPASYHPAAGDYELRFIGADDSGDFERWQVTLSRSGQVPVVLTPDGPSGYAFVTPDARYVFLEPLYVVDVKTMRRYALHRRFNVEPYISLQAYTRDGRLFIERSSCAMDCGRRTDEEYFELTLPPG